MRDHIEIKRYLAEMAPEPREATINLIDALRDYVRANDDQGLDLLYEGQITRIEYDKWMMGAERRSYLNLINKLEAEEIDPSLQGMLR